MGFGIALIGFCFLMLHEIGGGVFAAPVLAYGFFLASRLNSNFLRAAISALFIMPRGILQICSVFELINIDEMPSLNTVTFLLFLFAWMLTTYFWLTGVMEIAREHGAEKLERQARNRLVLTVGFLMFAAAAGVLNIMGLFGNLAYMIASAQYILQYIVIFIDLLFMHTCFILITSKGQYEKDKQQIAKERAESLEKRRQEQEVSKKFGKRK